ncbi:biotin synthase [Limnohabitans sp. DM1]|uniref:biotin synthase n=1 Tax=Limnohabitans sp. DM1 TaxID=1597955 RepID=UPI000A715399|nr:biotin synthase [Limnohabitans sp. DM1]
MSESECPPSLDPVAAARWSAYPDPVIASPWLHEEVAARMQERLDYIKLMPEQWVHWEPLRGGLNAHKHLQQRYPSAKALIHCEQAAKARAVQKALQSPWWHPLRWWGSKVQVGMPPDGQSQMLWANMQLHTCAQPKSLIEAWYRILAVDGFLMFSCLGPDTLRELRDAFAQRGWHAPAHEFTDMHDWGDMLVQTGFSEPVMDMERITLTFETPEKLLAELRGLGRNLSVKRFEGLRGRLWYRQLSDVLMTLAKPEAGGRLSLTFEIVYGHAIKPPIRMKVAPLTEIGLDQMRQMLRGQLHISDKV